MIHLKGNMGFGSMRNSSNTVLLIHSDTTDASTTFTDSASSHAITAQADAQHDTAQKKWGKTSMLFDGTGDYLTVGDHADFNMADGNVTIDFWVRFAYVTSGNQGVYQQYASAASYIRLWVSHTTNTILLYYDTGSGPTEIITVSYTFSVDTWYHVALIRGWGGSANVWAITVNGEVAGTATLAVTWPDVAADVQICRSTAEGPPELSNTLNGHIDEFRVVKGEAMWTSNFIVPAGPYS